MFSNDDNRKVRSIQEAITPGTSTKGPPWHDDVPHHVLYLSNVSLRKKENENVDAMRFNNSSKKKN